MRNSIRLTRSKDIRYQRIVSSHQQSSNSQDLIYIDNPKIKAKDEKKLFKKWNLSKKKLRENFYSQAKNKEKFIKLEVLKKASMMVSCLVLSHLEREISNSEGFCGSNEFWKRLIQQND